MGNKNDEKPVVYAKQGEIEKHGNADAKILAKAYDEFSKGGLTSNEASTLKDLDKVLKGAELIYGFDSNAALLVQENGDSYNLLGNNLKTKLNAPTNRTRGK